LGSIAVTSISWKYAPATGLGPESIDMSTGAPPSDTDGCTIGPVGMSAPSPFPSPRGR
jgi:hypothetical protein